MNQQRSRRFRAAREEALKAEKEEEMRLEWAKQNNNGNIGLTNEDGSRFDSNCITPGTPFMARLADCLRYYISDRLSNEPGWRGLKVILSDASVPGEGEHKIMDFIRRQRHQPTYQANTRHVLYGLDADLIMLAIGTHEPHFHILREDVFFKDGRQRGCFICGQSDHLAAVCTGKKKEKVGTFDDQSKFLEKKPFVFLHVAILREYLDVELRVFDLPFKWNLERAMDDWVFLCFFVGNDFLPHLPSLEIREGAIDQLIEIWKKNLGKWGYITNAGDLNIGLVKSLMENLGNIEDEVFIKRREVEETRRIARLRRKKEQKERQNSNKTRLISKKIDPKVESFTVKDFKKQSRAAEEDNSDFAKKLKLQLLGKKDPVSVPVSKIHSAEESEVVVEEGKLEGVTAQDSSQLIFEGVIEESVQDVVTEVQSSESIEEPDSDEEAPADNVRLWESGWKIRYYMNKFQVDIGDEAFRRKVVDSYIEGLAWVLKYYYQGVASWQWYFPFHYSPFASDFYLSNIEAVSFDLGKPFKPIEQLMGVLPAGSRSHIPHIFHSLMLNEDSPVLDFYPTDFPIDLNGKKFEWQGVALLPFIDSKRLLDAMQPLYGLLKPDEIKRNSLGNDLLFIGNSHSLFDDLCLCYAVQKVKEVPTLFFNIISRLYWIH